MNHATSPIAEIEKVLARDYSYWREHRRQPCSECGKDDGQLLYFLGVGLSIRAVCKSHYEKPVHAETP